MGRYMRIAMIFHANHLPHEPENEYTIGRLAEIWREQGHDVRSLIGCREHWDADVAILNVDLSQVPSRYVSFARQYPAAVNDRIIDIRKTTVSRNLVTSRSSYDGRVIAKTDLNSAGIPERKLLPRGRWRQLWRRVTGQGPLPPLEYVKKYAVYGHVRDVPAEVLAKPGIVLEKFQPERDGEWFFIRRCFALGDSAISYRMGDRQPIVDGGITAAFEWLENSPSVLAVRKQLGLDFGVVDYTEQDGEIVVFDVNKTPGRARPPDEKGQQDYEAILQHVSKGLLGMVGAGTRTVR